LYGSCRPESVGSPRPIKTKSPERRPYLSSDPLLSIVVRNLYSGPISARAAAVVNNFVFDAGVKSLSALSANRALPLLTDAMSIPQNRRARSGWERMVSICFLSGPWGLLAAPADSAQSKQTTATRATVLSGFCCAIYKADSSTAGFSQPCVHNVGLTFG